MPVFAKLPLLAAAPLCAQAAPLKVFVLAGQSNMQGHGYVDHGKITNGTLEYLVTDARTKAEFGKLKDGNDWASRDDVWIVYNDIGSGNPGAAEGEWHGDLTVGYGGDGGRDAEPGSVEMGPELGIGWALGDALEEQVLLVKMAWGGKSLDVDFRPPSAGGSTGEFYTKMVSGVRSALQRLPKLFPKYAGSYELAGFLWHQGWNDACSAGGSDPNHYEVDLASLIRDVRSEFRDLPGSLPVTVGVSGLLGHPPFKRCGGVGNTFENTLIPAQMAVADAGKYPEFAGTVLAVETRDFHRDVDYSPGDQCYHWNNNCESYWRVGQAIGNAAATLVGPSPPAPPTPPTPAPVATCEEKCAADGHCCTGSTSSYQHPSCAMGCTVAKHTSSLSECEQTCQKNDETCEWSIAGIDMSNCRDCPAGCDASDGVEECLTGCAHAFSSVLI